MERRRLKVRDLGGEFVWGPNCSSKLSVFGYGVGSSIVVGIVKS